MLPFVMSQNNRLSGFFQVEKEKMCFSFNMENSGKCTIWELSVDGTITDSGIMLQWQNIWLDHRLSLVSVDSDCLCCCSTERLQRWLF